ncbi:MAG: hypothetical protein IKK77_03885 [Clostridia bacterium]|nr:hypothetical protein [Clostridia bacterium]
MDYYLAIDLGTTGCRSIVFDDSVCMQGSAYEEYGLITPKECWVEQDAELWWTLTLRTAKKAIQQANIDPAKIRSICVSSQGITVVPVDAELKPLCNAISWLDTRAESQANRLKKDCCEKEMFLRTGKFINSCYTLPKLMWLQERRPRLFEDARWFLMPMDYLVGKFTGICITDHSMASGTLMYDIQNCCWSQETLEKYHIPTEKLPPIVWSGEPVGKVLPLVAEELGLSSECVVAAGAQDQKCAAQGVGLQEGILTVSLGTAGAITKLWTELTTYACDKVGWCGYTQPGAWVTEGVINTAGTCLRWVREMLFQGEDYATIDSEAQTAKERGSNLLFYPYLNGPSSPSYYPDAEGTFYGVNLMTQRGDFALAVMEGVAFQIRILLEAMDAYDNAEGLILFGGAAKSPLWCQIIADIAGLEIRVPSTAEAAGAGAAMLAAKATGKVIKPLACTKTYMPNDRTNYEIKYKKYRSIEAKLWNKG